MTLADALQERELAHFEMQRGLRLLLGDSGYAVLDEGSQARQKGNVERVLRLLSKELGSDMLNADQSARLDVLIREEFAKVPVDDTDVFRTPQDWQQFVLEHQQNIIRQIAPTLNERQIAALNKLAAMDRAGSEAELASKRKSYGLTP